MREPNVAAAIVGASTPEQLDENAAASGLKRPRSFSESRSDCHGRGPRCVGPVTIAYATDWRPENDLMGDGIKILGFAGSLRAGSLNRSLLRTVKELAPAPMQVDIFDLAQIPLYNGDVEATADPAGVADFKQAIRRADGVLMVTPEYNHGVPGVMKNAIDWA